MMASFLKTSVFDINQLELRCGVLGPKVSEGLEITLSGMSMTSTGTAADISVTVGIFHMA